MTQSSVPLAFQPAGHNHAACITTAMRHADRVCAERDLRLTPMRRRILELIWANHKPAKAYELLAYIQAQHSSARPPTIYRALDFLQQAGLVHRIASLNAFIGCNASACRGAPQFLICRGCGRVAEMASDRLNQNAVGEARSLGFQTEREIIELYGLCKVCRQTPDAASN